MKEFIRLSHIAATNNEGRQLFDFNLTVFSGELIFLTGVYGSGKQLVKEVLLGTLPIADGIIILEDQRQYKYSGKAAECAGIFCHDSTQILIHSLTVSDNLFLVRPFRRSRLLYRQNIARLETEHLLRQVNLSCSPDDKVYTLDPFSQALLGIAKAVSLDARLILLDLTGNSYNYNEFLRLKDVITALKKQGISFLIIDQSANPLLEFCDRAVVMNNGRDLKTWQCPPFDYDELHSCLYAEKKKHATFSSAEGVTGCYDLSPDWTSDFKSYLTQVIKKNETTPAAIAAGNPVLPDVCYITEQCSSTLHSHMTISDNLTLPRIRTFTGSAGRLNDALAAHYTDTFYQYFDINPAKKYPDELTPAERRLLTIYRCVYKPHRIICVENPDIGLDPEGQLLVFRYLSDLSSQGFQVLVTSRSLPVLTRHCSHLVLTQDYHIVKSYNYNEYDSLYVQIPPPV